jgi:hypothetical protein
MSFSGGFNSLAQSFSASSEKLIQVYGKLISRSVEINIVNFSDWEVGIRDS